ncbi:LmbE family protein [Beutenbergia cavernae DSM 12333]|uniref:LmbE family protein n=1 Tax=Beutenbergia cavernae (strain ATCC BAA-8 / DSM 12333 / CCUG 43141 / JCM 11478 / NBRC 16432 / NCIMB 13614 / HKI 0122) TaxID=471853 RepID=C5BY51_BEUC1|nr:PIG-L deacetylase family protein [Beutenbergia cavernae]ACQ80951.1 LmbE family protein [Beutenbergia cavernae DSM 12333]
MSTDTPTPTEPLRALREDWERALAVVAHPDDMEFGGSAAVSRWTRQGKQVAYLLLTSGEAGIDGMHPDEARVVREAEQRASCAVVGVSDVEFAGLDDGVLEYGLPMRRVIAEAVRRHRPDIVITGNFHDSWGPGSAPNQADHIATGRAVLDAVRDAGNRWVFHDQLTDGLEPWGGVSEVWVAASPFSRHGVDVTETFDDGVASLAEHRAYIEGLGWADFDPEEFLGGFARAAGERLGVGYAVAFERVSLAWGDAED